MKSNSDHKSTMYRSDYSNLKTIALIICLGLLVFGFFSYRSVHNQLAENEVIIQNQNEKIESRDGQLDIMIQRRSACATKLQETVNELQKLKSQYETYQKSNVDLQSKTESKLTLLAADLKKYREMYETLNSDYLKLSEQSKSNSENSKMSMEEAEKTYKSQIVQSNNDIAALKDQVENLKKEKQIADELIKAMTENNTQSANILQRVNENAAKREQFYNESMKDQRNQVPLPVNPNLNAPDNQVENKTLSKQQAVLVNNSLNTTTLSAANVVNPDDHPHKLDKEQEVVDQIALPKSADAESDNTEDKNHDGNVPVRSPGDDILQPKQQAEPAQPNADNSLEADIDAL